MAGMVIIMNKNEYIVLKQGDMIYSDKKFTAADLSKLESRLSALFMTVIILICTAIYGLVRVSFVSSGSMAPTLSVGEVGVARTVLGPGDLHRGDIVLFDPKTEENAPIVDLIDPDGVPFVKRLIGLPGERIRIEDDVVYINGEPLEEPYAAYPDSRTVLSEDRNTEEFTIPDGHYFIMGDNRDHSYDSRYGVGTIPYKNIKVKMMFHFTSLAAHILGTANDQYFING